MRVEGQLPANVVHNIRSQTARPRTKIFVIGFNKCGTRTLHHYFRLNGIKSCHWCYPGTLIEIKDLIRGNLRSGQDVLHGLQYTAFSDFVHPAPSLHLEHKQLFRPLHAQYPDSYFIFNDRDVNKWVKSRMAHQDGELIMLGAGSFRVDPSELPRVWAECYVAYKNAVLEYFGSRKRFLLFDIEMDPPNSLNAFLSESFALDLQHWKHRGKT